MFSFSVQDLTKSPFWGGKSDAKAAAAPTSDSNLPPEVRGNWRSTFSTHAHTKGMNNPWHGFDLISCRDCRYIFVSWVVKLRLISNTFIPKSLTESFKQKVQAVEKKLHDLMDEPIATRRKLFKDASWCTAWWHTKQIQIQQLKPGPEWRWKISNKWTNATIERSFFWRNPLKSWIASMADPPFARFPYVAFQPHPEWNQTSGSILEGRDGAPGATGGVSPWQEFFITCQRGLSASWIKFDCSSASSALERFPGFSQDIQSV